MSKDKDNTKKIVETTNRVPADLVPDREEGESLAMPEAIGMDEFNRLVESGEWSTEQVGKLEPGQCIAGVYLGPGPMITMAQEKQDPRTGEVYHDRVKTHRIEVRPRIVIALMGSYQVDRQLPTLKAGTQVAIAHRGYIKRGAKQVGDYRILVRGDMKQALALPEAPK